jgi:hypothetical protein
MRDPARIKTLLTEIEKYWNKFPDLRLFQLLENLIPQDQVCPFCQGVGHKVDNNPPNPKPGYVYLNICVRCQGTGMITISNYNVEDDDIIKKLETLNDLQKL